MWRLSIVTSLRGFVVIEGQGSNIISAIRWFICFFEYACATSLAGAIFVVRFTHGIIVVSSVTWRYFLAWCGTRAVWYVQHYSPLVR